MALFERARRITPVLLASATLALLAGCTGPTGSRGSACSVATEADGGVAKISCGDGTTAVIESGGGGSCSVKDNGNGTKTITCVDGSKVTVNDGKNGTTGAKGSNGANGTPGAKGDKGADGADGGNGTNGRNAYVVGAGLNLTIQGVTIPTDLRPVVSVTITDAAKRPLDRTGVYSVGTVSASFVLAYLPSATAQYVPYKTSVVTGVTVNNVAPALASATLPSSENNGTWTEVDTSKGTYTYRFANALPSGYDKTKTHTLAVYSSRTFDGTQYASNPIFSFRPDATAVTETHDIVTTAACNTCHDTLAVHGGSRREIGLCVTCHVNGMNDPESGNSIDFAQMIHKIHRGKNLPSVVGGKPYQIIGFNNSVNDYSTVAFPQPTENCTTCHQGGTGSDRWKTAFTRTACGSCHDNIAFLNTNPLPAGMKLHSGGQQTTDTLCSNCHAEGMGPIATLITDVTKVHLTALTDPSSPTLSGSILSMGPTTPSDTPSITFQIKKDGAPYNIIATPLSSLRFTFSGPTIDPVNYKQYTVQGTGSTGTLVASASGNPGEFTWTAPATISAIGAAAASVSGPAIPATGSWGVVMEGRLAGSWKAPAGVTQSVNFPMHNDVFYFPITDLQAVARRQATVVANCNNCHDNLAAHGGSRNDPEACVMCHTGNLDSIARQTLPAVGQTALTTSLRFSHMIHRIHTGDQGKNPFSVGGNDFSKVRFPGDRRDCQLCHVPGHYALPLQKGLIPSRWGTFDSTRTRVASSYEAATAAACTGCHDDDSTTVHALSMSIVSPTDPSSIDEACATCHAAGKDFGIDVVHARLGL